MDPRLEQLRRQRQKQIERVKRLKLLRRPGLREASPDPSPGGAAHQGLGVRRLVVISGFLAALIASIAAAVWSTRTQTLAVATPQGEPEMVAFAERLQSLVGEAHGGDLRLAVTPVGTVEEARDLLARGAVQLAIVRSDVEPPPRARSVAYLREDVVLLLALREPPVTVPQRTGSDELASPARTAGTDRPAGNIEGKVDDDAATEKPAKRTGGQGAGKQLAAVDGESLASALRGKMVGLLAGSSLEGLLRSVLAKHGIGDDSVTIVRDSWEALVDKLERRELAALFAVESPLGAGFIPRLSAAAGPTGRRLRVLELLQAQALVRRTQGLSTYDLAPGEPALPEEELGTVSVTWRLVTRTDVSPKLIEALSTSIFDRRSAFADTGSIARTLKAPPYEKDAFIPIHPGTLVYINAEPKSLMELYGDYFYIGMSLAGLIASSIGYVVARIKVFAGW